MGLIRMMGERYDLRKEDKSILKEIAQVRHNKKILEQLKQKEFDNMLNFGLPCANIIRLQNPFNDQVEYYLMGNEPLNILQLMNDDVKRIPCQFKQLTGVNAGRVYGGTFNPKLCESKVSMYLNPRDKSELVVSINGCINYHIGQSCGKKSQLEKKYGKTISIRQLLLLWKIDNEQMLDIDINEDYQMVKSLYDSEDILVKSKTEELSK